MVHQNKNKDIQKKIQNDPELAALFAAVDNEMTWGVDTNDPTKSGELVGRSEVTDYSDEDEDIK